jgi:hypothetical protein
MRDCSLNLRGDFVVSFVHEFHPSLQTVCSTVPIRVNYVAADERIGTALAYDHSHSAQNPVSIGGEAVEETVAASAPQVFLTAAPRRVRRVPRGRIRAATLPIMMAYQRAALPAARPVPAGCRGGVASQSRSVQL